MSQKIIIEGVKLDGQKFRPSDWVERVASLFAVYKSDCRLHYNGMIQPCVIGGKKCLVVDSDLTQSNPDAFEYLMNFAERNELSIIEDRRAHARKN